MVHERPQRIIFHFGNAISISVPGFRGRATSPQVWSAEQFRYVHFWIMVEDVEET